MKQFPDKFNIKVTCASGIEKVTKGELSRLGYENVPANNGALIFSGNQLDVARCNLFLRSADRVYIELSEFKAETFDELFDGVREIEWENYLPENANFIVNGKCAKSTLFAISACQSIVKKAICERLSHVYKVKRLVENGDKYEIEFAIFKDIVSISINTSGAGLHKRGYRDLVGIAPIRETLASALVLLSDYYYQKPFLDPFCGSGTIAIETARIGMNIAGGMGRRFAFNDWKNFDEKFFDEAFTEAKDKEHRDAKLEILASDIDPKAIKLATHHAERAGVKDKIQFFNKDVKYFSTDLSLGTIVTNPPYGERVYDKQQADECYESLGKLYKSLDRWSAFVITSARDFERKFGMRSDRNRKLFNSNKECKFYYYYGNKKENKK